MIQQLQENDRRILVIKNSSGSAKISLYGAQILSWIPAGQSEVFYVSPSAQYQDGKAIRGGSPLCWPWFGKAGQPAHGWARTSLWRVVSIQDMGGSSSIVELEFKPESLTSWARMKFEILPDELKMTLTTHVGEDAMDLSFAFHNYFSVSDLAKLGLSGLEDAGYTEYAQGDPVDGLDAKILVFSGALDRVYAHVDASSLVIEDSGMNRKIEIIQSETQPYSVVVWNPGEEGAHSIGDIPNRDWNRFLCVETGRVTPNVVSLESGAVYSFTQVIRVK